MAVGFAAFAAGAQVVNTLATTGMSFAQAAQARRDMEAADRVIKEKTEDLYRGLTKNVYEGLSLPMKEKERQARLAAEAYKTATEAAREGDPRGAGATAGRAFMTNQQRLEKQAIRDEQAKFNLDKLIAAEESRLNDLRQIVRMEEIEGAQLARREGKEMQQKAMTEGFQGVTATLGAAASFVPLFQKSKAARLAKQALKNNPQLQQQLAERGMFGGVDTSGVGDMSPLQFQDFITAEDRFTIDQLKDLRDYTQNVERFDKMIDTSRIMDAGNITMPGVGMSPFDATGLQGEVSQELLDLLGYTPTPTSELASDPRFERKLITPFQ